METRRRLDCTFRSLPGIAKVYYQPPEGMLLEYPCIVYELASVDTKHANNANYFAKPAYEATLMDRNPDSPIFFKMAELPFAKFTRAFSANGITHFRFKIY